MRNAITAQTFLASTVLTILTVVSGRMWDVVKVSVGWDRKRAVAQFVGVGVCLLLSAHEFLLSARFMTHAGFMFPVAGKDGTIPESAVDEVIGKSQSSQWLGLRMLYLGINTIVWILGGEYAFGVSSVVFWRFFASIDKPPQ